MRQVIFSLSCFGLVGLVACVGKAPSNTGGGDDVADAGVDAPPVVTSQRLSGKTMDYFAATALTDAAITSDGVAPPMMTTSLADGAFAIADVPTGSKVYFSVAKTAYRPTRNTPIAIADMPVIENLYLLAKADVDRQYLKANNTPVGIGKAFLTAELKRNNGMPLDGIPLANVTLVDAAGAPVPGIVGPFFYGALGDVDPALTVSTIVGGRARVAILDVPPGSYTLKVLYPMNGGGTATMLVPVTFAADGATLAVTGSAAGGGGGGGGGGTPNPTFAADIYPRLQKAATGGLGCANCHTLGGPAGAVLKFDDPAATVLTNMKALAGVISLATPASSLLLTKPLYEPAPYNHPNVTFLDINDVDYKLFLKWIQLGALP